MGELYEPYPKLPKNIRQIGERDQVLKLYLEDYVNSYLKRLRPAGGSDLRVGLLHGKLRPKEKEAAMAAAEQLKALLVKIPAKAGTGGRLFGAVTTKEISDGLRQQFGIDIPKQKLVLDEPIKAFGSYQVKAKLGFEVNGTVYVSVFEEK